MIKLRKVEIEKNFVNLQNLTHSGERVEAFPFKPGMRKTCPVLYCTGQPRMPRNEIEGLKRKK